MILFFTLLATTAQVLWKYAFKQLGGHPEPLQLLLNPLWFTGLVVYGLGSIVMIVALKHGELSVLYPLISLNYVWVAIMAVLLFQESMNPLKIAGICIIMLGVGVLGKGAHK